MHRVLEFHLLIPALRVSRLLHFNLFQEGLARDIVLADGGGIPGEVRARRIDLVEARLVLVVSDDQQRYTEGTHTSRLRIFLHDGGDFLNEDGARDLLLCVIQQHSHPHGKLRNMCLPSSAPSS